MTNILRLQSIVKNHQRNAVRFADGTTTQVDVQTANVLCTVYEALRPDLRGDFADKLDTSRGVFMRLVTFAYKMVK